MIWVGGRIVPDSELKVSVLDRSFEHGLGLFETLRTWNGRAPLLADHLARLRRSAAELGLPCPGELPDDAAVAGLLTAEQAAGDVMLRITMSGGLDETTGATLWMRTATLPFEMNRSGAVVELGPWRVFRDDPLARHKTLNYWSRRRTNEAARKIGYDEVLSLGDDGCVWEGSRTNVFAVVDSFLITPTLNGPIIPGIMRGLILQTAKSLPLKIRETSALTRETLAGADEVFLTNSVRGVIPVAAVGDLSWRAPGDWTRLLQSLTADRLFGGETMGGPIP